MALVFEKNHQGVNYQIVQAGNSIRLYTDKVLHTQYNHQQKLTSSVWDLLFLPALVFPVDKPLRVLVLGVGGGAVLKMLDEYFHCTKITGLELNPMHIQLAEKFFQVKGRPFELIEGDAIEYVENYQGEKFDLIIDDLFYEEDNEPIKVAAPDNIWLLHLYSILKPNGVIAMNFVGRKAALSAAPLHNGYLMGLLPNCLHFTTPFYDNHVLAFSKREMMPGLVKQGIKQRPLLASNKNKLRYACRQLK